MINKQKVAATLMTLTTGILLAPLANAQDASSNYFNNNGVSTTAGVHMTIPFGGKNTAHVVDKARFGLMLNMTREYNDLNFYAPKRVNTKLLDLGMQFNGRPTLLISGEDYYTPLFAPLSASEGGMSKNTVLLAAGAALAVGAAVALAGSGGDDNDDDDRGRDNDD